MLLCQLRPRKIWILFIILIAAVAVGAGVFVYSKNNSKEGAAKPQDEAGIRELSDPASLIFKEVLQSAPGKSVILKQWWFIKIKFGFWAG